jgi:putative ABC transport system substrate-binding protein
VEQATGDVVGSTGLAETLSVPVRSFGRCIERVGQFALALAVLAAPLVVAAQQPGSGYRIGYIATTPLTAPGASRSFEAFRHGLGELGWVEGRNIAIEYRDWAGRSERLPAVAAELVRLKVDVIVATAAPATLASKQATTTIPIVGVGLSDPVGQGLVTSLVRPGANVTGLASLLPELAAKRLELLREALPVVSRVAVLSNAANAGNVRQIEETRAAAQTLGLKLEFVEVRGPDFQAAFAAMTRARPEALVVLADPLTFSYRTQIVDFAARSRLPAIHPFRESVEAGGLMAYGVDLADMYRRAATYVDKILRGAKPADLPIEQPTKFEFAINIKAAQALGLAIPQSLLLRADRVVE